MRDGRNSLLCTTNFKNSLMPPYMSVYNNPKLGLQTNKNALTAGGPSFIKMKRNRRAHATITN